MSVVYAKKEIAFAKWKASDYQDMAAWLEYIHQLEKLQGVSK